MNLNELITDLKTKSGRLDLTDPECSDYINQGIRLLDELETSGGKVQRVFASINAGEKIVKLPVEKRWIDRVFLHGPTGRTELYEVDAKDIRSSMLETSVNDTPYCYALVNPNIAGTPDAQVVGLLSNYDAVTFDPSNVNQYILVSPISDGTYYIEVEGCFFSPKLTSTVLQNRWSVYYPDLVYQAAQVCMLTDLLELTTADNLKKMLMERVRDITNDEWSEEDINVMGG